MRNDGGMEPFHLVEGLLADAHHGAVETQHMTPLVPDANAEMPDHAIEWTDQRGISRGILIRTLRCSGGHNEG